MTEPLKDLLDPNHVKTGAKDLTCIIDPLLTEEINRATQLVQQVQDATVQSATEPRDDVHIATTLFLHVIEIRSVRRWWHRGCFRSVVALRSE